MRKISIIVNEKNILRPDILHGCLFREVMITFAIGWNESCNTSGGLIRQKCKVFINPPFCFCIVCMSITCKLKGVNLFYCCVGIHQYTMPFYLFILLNSFGTSFLSTLHWNNYLKEESIFYYFIWILPNYFGTEIHISCKSYYTEMKACQYSSWMWYHTNGNNGII